MALSLRQIRKIARISFLLPPKSALEKTAWGVSNIEILHKDIQKVNKLTDESYESYEGPFAIVEIPPPLCPKCNSIILNKCKADIFTIDNDDLNLVENPSLIIKCPIFGEVR